MNRKTNHYYPKLLLESAFAIFDLGLEGRRENTGIRRPPELDLKGFISNLQRSHGTRPEFF